MYCTQCGFAVSENDNYCARCGKALKPQILSAPNPNPPQPRSALPAVPSPKESRFFIDVTLADQFRARFNSVGYKHPNNPVSQDYNRALKQAKISAAPINSDVESVIIHFGFNTDLVDGIKAQRATWYWKNKNQSSEESRKGQLLITNLRIIFLASSWRYSNTVGDGWSIPFSEFKNTEFTEFKKHSQFKMIGRDEVDMTLQMSFVSAEAQLGQALQVMGAIGLTPQPSSYVERKDYQASLNNHIASHLARVNSLKQVFATLLQYATGNI